MKTPTFLLTSIAVLFLITGTVCQSPARFSDVSYKTCIINENALLSMARSELAGLTRGELGASACSPR